MKVDSLLQMCNVCEIMFGVNRYDVSKLFIKRSPEYFLERGGNKTDRAFNTRHAAAIYAENGNHVKALEYYKLAVSILEGKSWQYNYQQRLDEYIKYYDEYGTSILSSNF